jgi:hypothetical protein
VKRDFHAWFWERPGVKFPRATRQSRRCAFAPFLSAFHDSGLDPATMTEPSPGRHRGNDLTTTSAFGTVGLPSLGGQGRTAWSVGGGDGAVGGWRIALAPGRGTDGARAGEIRNIILDSGSIWGYMGTKGSWTSWIDGRNALERNGARLCGGNWHSYKSL